MSQGIGNPRTYGFGGFFLFGSGSRGRRGYSVVDEEAEPGLYSVAVPVRDFLDSLPVVRVAADPSQSNDTDAI
jgi:hypothetical protein